MRQTPTFLKDHHWISILLLCVFTILGRRDCRCLYLLTFKDIYDEINNFFILFTGTGSLVLVDSVLKSKLLSDMLLVQTRCSICAIVYFYIDKKRKISDFSVCEEFYSSFSNGYYFNL